MIPNFPPSFPQIQELYRDFEPLFEYRRQSFSEWWVHYLGQVDLDAFAAEINSNSVDARELRRQLKQRHFYRSATCFYRSFDLFLSYLSLQSRKFGTWAEVSGYYSRFYFTQALLNLFQASWFGSEDSIPRDNLVDRRDRRFFVYNSGAEFTFLREAELITALGGTRQGSHAIWWSIYSQLGRMQDPPQIDSLNFVLGDAYFNPQQRNEVNYSHEYIRGFPELEWFDSGLESMRAHFRFQPRRSDRDITDIDRYFEGFDPESVDVGDFYSDEGQVLWCSIDCYLRILSALVIRQDFIAVDKLEFLTRTHIGDELPRMADGIVLGVREALP